MSSSYVNEYRKLDERADALEERAADYKSRAEDNRWEQCRIAHAATTSGEFSQRGFAEAVGKSANHIGRQVRMWAKHGVTARSQRPTYWEAQADIRNHSTGDERTREIARQGVKRLPPQEKADVVRDLMQDEDVATAAAADPKVRASFAKASEDVVKQTGERQRERIPEIAEHEDALAVLNTLRAFTRLRRDLREAMDDLKSEHLSEDDREALEEAARRTTDAIDLFTTTLRSEDWDDALAQLVEGGDA